MKKCIFLIMLIPVILTGCSKKNSTSAVESNIVEVQDTGSLDIGELIDKLGGGQPKTSFKYMESSFIDLNGNKKSLSEYKGNVIFLNLWATWCPPCREEMPSMEKLYNKLKDRGFVILAVSAGEDQETVKKFLEKNKYSFPIFTDNQNSVAGNYGTGSIPTTYIIDKEGFILARFVGGRDWNSPDAVNLFNLLLN